MSARDDSKHLILVLGPMAVPEPNILDRISRAFQRVLYLLGRRDSEYVPDETSRTERLRDLIDEIAKDLPEAAERGVRYEVKSPEDRPGPELIVSILRLIEDAELVVIDLSGHRVNTAYEVAIVHALGLPHILVTSGDQPPFYFRTAEMILDFDPIGRFDGRLRHHRLIQQRLVDFTVNSDVENLERFSGNVITGFYGGLPIVDIAGPSGLAAGYYANVLRRFFDSNGFVGAPVKVVWASKGEDRQTLLKIGAFLAIRPPIEGLDQPFNDVETLTTALGSWGLQLQRATLQPRGDDDKRTFGCNLLMYKDTGMLVEPAIVVDIPTTLYALQYAPRVRRLVAQGRGVATGALRKRRILSLMVEAFERNIQYQFAAEPDGGRERPYHFVRVGAELHTRLEGLGVRIREA